jgi:hypothetical protein
MDEVIWLCSQMQPDTEYFCAVTSDMQRLQGIIGGIVSEGQVDDDEVRALDGPKFHGLPKAALFGEFLAVPHVRFVSSLRWTPGPC